MAIREGAWDCPHCGRTGNRGSAKFCGGCGAPRGEDVRFYLPDDAREVSDAAELRKAMAGPDWICPYCQGDNGAESSFCSGCGAPRDGAAVRPLVETRLAPPVVPAPQPVVSKGRAGGLLKKGCGIGCLGLLVLFGLIWFLGRPREATLTAQGFSWERSIQIEALQAVTEEAWEDAVPAGARVLAMYASANRDETVFTDPFRFDITRDPNHHIAFGGDRLCMLLSGAESIPLEPGTGLYAGFYVAAEPGWENVDVSGGGVFTRRRGVAVRRLRHERGRDRRHGAVRRDRAVGLGGAPRGRPPPPRRPPTRP